MLNEFTISFRLRLQFLKNKRGLTLTETAVVLGIIFILLALAVPTYRFFEREGDLTNSVEEIINALRLAQNRTLASDGAANWGVYFSTSTNQYILFKGNSYSSRIASLDEVRSTPKTIEIYDAVLTGGYEIVFERITGNASSTGTVSLRQKDDFSKTKTIYVENSGRISQTATSTPSDDNREKDSRHVHFDYDPFPAIATDTDIITLSFGATAQNIAISSNLKNNQIYWEGEVIVDGETQKLKIHTHRLNDPISGSQFSIHRDRRYNNKTLSITIGGDGTGDLISYDATGIVATGTSSYVSNTQIQ